MGIFKNSRLMRYFAASVGGSLLTVSAMVATFPSLREDVQDMFNNEAQATHVIDTEGRSVLVSFRGILETGYVEDTGTSEANRYRVNIHAEDYYGRAYRDILKKAIESVEQSATLQALLDKPTWTIEDRVEWEREIAGIVSSGVADVPGLDEYRTLSEDDVQRNPNLNMLSFDIRDDSERYEFDCEAMAITEGMLLQELDIHFLPFEAEEFTSLRAQGTYYYTAGRRSDFDDDTMSTWHAYIISKRTGNIIEAVHEANKDSGSPYMESADPYYSFYQFIRGVPFVEKVPAGRTPDVFGLNMTMNEATAARAEFGPGLEDEGSFKIAGGPQTP